MQYPNVGEAAEIAFKEKDADALQVIRGRARNSAVSAVIDKMLQQFREQITYEFIKAVQFLYSMCLPKGEHPCHSRTPPVLAASQQLQPLQSPRDDPRNVS